MSGAVEGPIYSSQPAYGYSFLIRIICIIIISFFGLYKLSSLVTSDSSNIYHLVRESQSGESEIRRLHINWIGTRPLRAIALAAIDSIGRHMPGAEINVHITVEAAIPSIDYERRKAVLLSQQSFFTERNVSLRLHFHENPYNLTANTPLELFDIEQKNIAGQWATDSHWSLGPHSSDLVRIVIAYKEGGIFLDDDILLTRDLEPLLRTYGPAILVTHDASLRVWSCKVGVANGFFAVPKMHPLIIRYMIIVARLFKENGIDCYIPGIETNKKFCGWNFIGPTAISDANMLSCDSAFPPVLINMLTAELEMLINNSSYAELEGKFQARPIIDPRSYTLITRKYMSPIHWGTDDFLYSNENVDEKKKQVDVAFSVHIFNKAKKDYMNVVSDADLYPMGHYIHSKSCKLLCDLNQFRKLLFNIEKDM